MYILTRELVYGKVHNCGTGKFNICRCATCTCTDLNVHKHGSHFADTSAQIASNFFAEFPLFVTHSSQITFVIANSGKPKIAMINAKFLISSEFV